MCTLRRAEPFLQESGKPHSGCGYKTATTSVYLWPLCSHKGEICCPVASNNRCTGHRGGSHGTQDTDHQAVKESDGEMGKSKSCYFPGGGLRTLLGEAQWPGMRNPSRARKSPSCEETGEESRQDVVARQNLQEGVSGGRWVHGRESETAPGSPFKSSVAY